MGESRHNPELAGIFTELGEKMKAHELMSRFNFLPDDTGAAEYADKVLESTQIGESFTYDIGGEDNLDDLLEVRRVDENHYVIVRWPK